jgi:hypothetical protein
MSEVEVAISAHVSHTMGIKMNDNTGNPYDVCLVCHECSCHSPSALDGVCDDISWVFTAPISN